VRRLGLVALVVACASESGGMRLGTVGTGIDIPPVSLGQDVADDIEPDIALAEPDVSIADDTSGQIDAAPVCVPSCAGRECGDDGCGGSCGSCPIAAPKCGDDGKCTFADCVPDCEGKECGYEWNCGTWCGACPEAAPNCGPTGLCQVEECVPDCKSTKYADQLDVKDANFTKNNDCGDDGCSGLCGTCQADQLCVLGHCAEPCNEGDGRYCSETYDSFIYACQGGGWLEIACSGPYKKCGPAPGAGISCVNDF
jgi:hypothetical protein